MVLSHNSLAASQPEKMLRQGLNELMALRQLQLCVLMRSHPLSAFA